MKLDELLPALHNLPRRDKFRAVQFLTAELAQGEAGLTPGAEYPIWSPYEANDAAATLTNFLEELLLGQVNFFEEFDVCFHRARRQFEVEPARK